MAPRRRRDPGRQRPGPAGRGRGRAAAPHQRAPAPLGRDDARPVVGPTSTPRSTVGRDVTLFPGVILQGDTSIGDGTEIGPNTRLRRLPASASDCIDRADDRPRRPVGDGRMVGPYAVLGRGAEVPSDFDTGPFYTLDGRSEPRPGRGGRGLGGYQWNWSPRSGSTLVAGRVNRELAEEVAATSASSSVRVEHRRVRERRAPLPLRRVDPRRRPLHLPEPLRGRRTCRSTTRSMEHLIMVDAAKRASAKRITVVAPFYGYGRQDRKAEGREPITAKLVANMFEVAGAKRIVSVDLHSGQIQGFFDGPVDHLTAMPVLVDWMADEPARGPGRGLARRRPREGGRALRQPAPRRPRHRPQAAGPGPEEHRRGQGGRRRGRGPHLRADRRHDRHRRHDRGRGRAADRARCRRGVLRGAPTGCSPARPSTASRTR